MKDALKIIVLVLAAIGAFVVVEFIKEIRTKSEMERAYMRNCENLRIGMSKDEAVQTMKDGLKIRHDGYYTYLDVENDSISELSLSFNVNGGSDVIRIQLDSKTGRVVEFECPEIEN